MRRANAVERLGDDRLGELSNWRLGELLDQRREWHSDLISRGWRNLFDNHDNERFRDRLGLDRNRFGFNGNRRGSEYSFFREERRADRRGLEGHLGLFDRRRLGTHI